jgi:hypothetical protein
MTSQNIPSLENRVPSQSNFVTVLAWVLIVSSGLATFISLMQAATLTFVFPRGFWLNSQSPHGGENIPPVLQFLSSHVQYFFLAFWLLAVLSLVSSIGLVRRKNWARLIVIGILGLGVVWNLGGIWLQWQLVSTFNQLPAQAPPEFTQQMETMMVTLRVGTTVVAFAIAVLFAWLIKRLVSPSIRSEFGAHNAPEGAE